MVKSEVAPVWVAPDRQFRAAPDAGAARDVSPAPAVVPPEEGLPEVVLPSWFPLPEVWAAAEEAELPPAAECSRTEEPRAQYAWYHNRRRQKRLQEGARGFRVVAFYVFRTAAALASRERGSAGSI